MIQKINRVIRLSMYWVDYIDIKVTRKYLPCNTFYIRGRQIRKIKTKCRKNK